MSTGITYLEYSPAALKQAMADAGMSQTELSQASMLSQANVSNFISGKSNPKEEALRKLGRALNVVFIADWRNEDWDKTQRYKTCAV
jgi:transcriptional regulator with XRE-family HTH domain